MLFRSVPEDREEQAGIAFSNMLEAYEALKSDEKGSRARTTKEGFLHHILTFLQKQGLIEYVEQDVCGTCGGVMPPTRGNSPWTRRLCC